MVNRKHLEIVKQGAEAIKQWRSAHLTEKLDLSSADLKGVDLRNADLRDADLSKADLSKVSLIEADLSKANLSEANFTEAILISADFGEANLKDATLDAVQSNLVKFNRANLSFAKLRGAYLVGSDLSKSILYGTDLSGAVMRGVTLNDADLSEANLLGIEINSSTAMKSISKVIDCKIDRYSLEYLRSQTTDLNDGMMWDMKIYDDVAILKSQFGSIWGAIHLTSIILFVAPYLWFLFTIRPMAEFNATAFGTTQSIQHTIRDTSMHPEKTSKSLKPITLFNALLRYVWSGGVNWDGKCEFNFWPFTAFLFFLFYNGNRVALLWKTKKLETQETVTKLPVRFSLNQSCLDYCINSKTTYFAIQSAFAKLVEILNAIRWRHIFNIVNKGVWVYIFIVLYNSYHFLQMKILI